MSRPRCVLLPGLLCDGEVLDAQVTALSDEYDPEVVSLSATSIGQAVDAILLSQPQRFALIGFSLGGIVGAACAIRSPERITDLILVATNATAPRPEQREQWRNWRTLLAAGSFESAARQATEAMLADTSDPTQWQLAERMARRVGRTGFDRQLTMQESRVDLRPDLHRISARTYLAAGSVDPLCPPRYLQMIAERVPRSTLRVYEACGHLIPFARARQFADDVLGFLRSSE